MSEKNKKGLVPGDGSVVSSSVPGDGSVVREKKPVVPGDSPPVQTQEVYNEENIPRPSVHISVRDLVEFILRSGDIDNRHKASGDSISILLEGARIHRAIQRKMGADYHAEFFMRYEYLQPEYDIVIEGRADGVICSDEDLLRGPAEVFVPGDGSVVPTEIEASTGGLSPGTELGTREPSPGTRVPVIDEIKTTFKELERINEPVDVHLAQAKVYAFIFAMQHNMPEIGVRMTYVNVETQELKYFHETYTRCEITRWFEQLMRDYVRWADQEFHWKITRNDSIKETRFPFEYREGQKDLAAGVYRTIYHKKRLFIEAPTGVGKTISTVFPAVKSMGEGLCDRIFYLTAKTITRTVAVDCLDILRDKGLKMKSVVITAKEKICPLEECLCNPDECERARGHYDRINDAIYDLLMSEDSFDRETIEEYASRHKVCPFEMSLDMSLFSDTIICDYNYVFDPNVYLRRFFGEGVSGNYIFLIDEAHNLVDRAMNMYSAILIKEQILEVSSIVKSHDQKLHRALGNTNRQMLALKRECDEFLVPESISALVVSLNRLLTLLEKFLDEKDRLEQRDQVLDLYFNVRHFLNMYDNMGENDYVTYCEHLSDGRFMVKLLCTDPSASLRKCLDKGRSSVFFSATLLPVNYYQNLLSGDTNDYTVYANSVFDPRKRGLFVAGDVSSKYTRRGPAEYLSIASYIGKITAARNGNYMVFFPSHAFLNEVYTAFMEGFFEEERHEVLLQKSNMNEEEREEFLNRFAEPTCNRALIGFCAMGGIFAEGIDLKHDALIGAIIVGTGLPMVTNERQLLRDCYDEREWDGFDYAYKYPGMNKVMQAAGRVIRTVTDVGVVTLLDERFLTASYRALFPREWKNYEIVNLNTIEDAVAAFWESVDE